MKASRILKKWTETSLVLRILCGLVIGAALGLLCPKWTGIGILGQVFVSGLRAIAPILVAVLVTASIVRAKGGLGPRFRTVIILYLATTLLAAVLAVAASFLFPVTLKLEGVAGGESAGGPTSLADVFTKLLTGMVMNPVAALAEANYIAILFWAILLGVALRLLAGGATIRMVSDFAGAVSRVVEWIIQFAPFGILGLVFTSVSGNGLDIFVDYGKLLALLVGCMLVTGLVTNPLVAALMLRRNPYPLLWRCLRTSGLSAFFTRSSAANIPINMELCRDLGLEEDFYSVSIPLGSTINMNGAAVTITVLTLAVDRTVGVEASFASAIFLSVIATLGACGSSGVAGGSLLLVPMACSFFGIPGEIAMQAVAVGFIIGVVQDSMETALNSSSDVFFTATAEYFDRQKKRRLFGNG